MFALGILSASILLAAFITNEAGALRTNGFWYDLANTIGSAGLLAYAVAIHAWPFVLVNAVWGAVALFELARRLWVRYARRV